MKTETKKSKIVKNLWGCLQVMDACRREITELNKNGQQFDYVTDAKLSDVIDRLDQVNKAINNLVYQKVKNFPS